MCVGCFYNLYITRWDRETTSTYLERMQTWSLGTTKRIRTHTYDGFDPQPFENAYYATWGNSCSKSHTCKLPDRIVEDKVMLPECWCLTFLYHTARGARLNWCSSKYPASDSHPQVSQNVAKPLAIFSVVGLFEPRSPRWPWSASRYCALAICNSPWEVDTWAM